MFDAAGVVTGPGGRAAAEDEIRTRTRSDEATNVEPNEKGGRCALFCRQRAAPSQDRMPLTPREALPEPTPRMPRSPARRRTACGLVPGLEPARGLRSRLLPSRCAPLPHFPPSHPSPFLNASSHPPPPPRKRQAAARPAPCLPLLIRCVLFWMTVFGESSPVAVLTAYHAINMFRA